MKTGKKECQNECNSKIFPNKTFQKEVTSLKQSSASQFSPLPLQVCTDC